MDKYAWNSLLETLIMVCMAGIYCMIFGAGLGVGVFVFRYLSGL